MIDLDQPYETGSIRVGQHVRINRSDECVEPCHPYDCSDDGVTGIVIERREWPIKSHPYVVLFDTRVLNHSYYAEAELETYSV